MSLLNLNPNSVINNQSDNKSTNRSSQSSIFTKNNIPSLNFKKKKKQSLAELPKVRILPAFDFSLYGNDSFEASWVPFKTADQSQFTQWALPVKGYTYFGNLWAHFLSPATLQASDQKYPTKYSDPITDLRSFIYNSNKYAAVSFDGVTPLISQEELELITLPKESDKFIVIPSKPRTFLLCNALVENSKTGGWENKVLILSSQAYKILAETLDVRPRKSDPEVNPNFPDCLFGDITDPKTGCILYPRESYTDSGIPALTLSPSMDGKSLSGFQQMPVTTEQLKSRLLINDSDNVLDIWSYQQILDQMCKDPAIPLDLLRKAMDNSAFNESAVLHEELREVGIAEIQARDEAIAAFKQNTNNSNGGFNRATTQTNQSIQQKPSFATVFGHLNTSNQINVVPNTQTQPTQSVTNNITPKLIDPSTITTNMAPKVQQEAKQNNTQAPTSSNLTPEEMAEFAKLTQNAQTNNMAAQDMMRYVQLMRKANNMVTGA